LIRGQKRDHPRVQGDCPHYSNIGSPGFTYFHEADRSERNGSRDGPVVEVKVGHLPEPSFNFDDLGTHDGPSSGSFSKQNGLQETARPSLQIHLQIPGKLDDVVSGLSHELDRQQGKLLPIKHLRGPILRSVISSKQIGVERCNRDCATTEPNAGFGAE